MKFADILGHEDVKERLRHIADTGRLPHALLLEGPDGTAKFALARAFAQYLRCTDRHDGDSCGVCPQCRRMQSFRHIDTIYSFPVVKRASGKDTISNDYLAEFQQFITDHPWMDADAWLTALDNPNTPPTIFVAEANELSRRLSYTSHDGSRYKIVLLWQPERMREDTANKMLKLIEEPPADTLFILTSDNPRAILPTIYSRVQRIEVRRYEDSEIADWLMTQGVGETQLALDTARLAQGSLNSALALVNVSDENRRHFEWFVQLMRLAYQRDIAKLKLWSNTVGAEKRDRLTRFLDYCARMIRENFIYNFRRPELNIETADEAAFSVNFARFIHERNVIPLEETFSTARRDIAANANPKIALFDLSISTILLIKS